MRIKYKDPKLCDFNKIELEVPRYKILKLVFKKTFLTFEEYIFLKELLWKSESAENKLRHMISLIEKALLKKG